MVTWRRVVSAAGLLLVLGPSAAHAQTLQLPTSRYFSVRTSVLAPDRGGARLGGVTRSHRATQAADLPGGGWLPGLGLLTRNRASGRADGASTSSVHVTVIDHAALDQAVLAEAARRRGADHSPRAVDALSARYRSAARQASSEGGRRRGLETGREQVAGRGF